MSRKKIVIKMPSADQADAGEPSPEAGSHAEVLGWRLRRFSRATQKPTAGFAPKTWFHSPTIRARGRLSPTRGLYAALPRDSTIDLAAERTFMQVLALSFFLPSVLGWFWVANAVKRYRQLFAVPH